MRIISGILLLILSVACSSVQKNSKHAAISVMSPSSSLSESELDPVRQAIGEKKIVMMGESIHLAKQFSEVRAKLIKNLHQKGGFDLLLFEGSPVEFWIAEENHRSSKSQADPSSEFQKTALFGLWQTEEIKKVIQYALSAQPDISAKPLYLSSYDVQIGQGRRFIQGQKIFATLAEQLKNRGIQIDQGEHDEIQNLEKLALCKMHKFPASEKESQDALRGIKVLRAVIARNSGNPSASDTHESFLKFLPTSLEYTLDFCREAASSKRNYTEIRDEWSAKQFKDMLSFTGKKAMVWAHSGHVRQAKPKKGRISFGAYARQDFPSDIYAIHFTAKTGSAISFMDQNGNEIEFTEKEILPIGRVSLESKLADMSRKDFFINALGNESVFGPEETTRSEPEGFGVISPLTDFDGYYFIQKLAPPTLNL